MSVPLWVRSMLFRYTFYFLVVGGLAAPGITLAADGDPLAFDAGKYTTKELSVDGRTVAYRAYEGIVYVANPVDKKYQCMNIYIPTAYFEGQGVGAYTADTAPIFMPNTVGGYMPGTPGSLGQNRRGGSSASALALSKGFIVAAPGARGRNIRDQDGKYTGKAPACIVDLKAAVRYLRHNDKAMPGDAQKIISNGTSAGGALSALLGATGDSPDYAPYLKEIGAADESDAIFASSCYCPITNLDHADAAYEWLFGGMDEFNFRGRKGTLTTEQKQISDALKQLFPAYLNSLKLKADDGSILSLDDKGNGAFKEYLKSFVVASAQKALDGGKDLSSLSWITIEGSKVKDLDFEHYVRYAMRGKTPPAFDGLDMRTPENNLFGSASVDNQHFTEYSRDHGADHAYADPAVVKLLNPMDFIGASGVKTAGFWRIRHGAADRDTSLAIPVLLATKLKNAGCKVDVALPWGVEHSGDYDLDELFQWMERIVK